jgi:hypothetical protein
MDPDRDQSNKAKTQDGHASDEIRHVTSSKFLKQTSAQSCRYQQLSQMYDRPPDKNVFSYSSQIEAAYVAVWLQSREVVEGFWPAARGRGATSRHDPKSIVCIARACWSVRSRKNRLESWIMSCRQLVELSGAPLVGRLRYFQVAIEVDEV